MPGIIKNGIYAYNTPSAPVALSAASIAQTSFVAQWESSKFAISYRIDVATDINFTSLIVNNATTRLLSFNVGSLTANTTYYYRVRAVNNVGTSTNSNVISVTTSVHNYSQSHLV